MKLETRTNNVSMRTACEAVMANSIDMGGQSKFARIPCELLFLDEYQRDEKTRNTAKIIRNWDEDKCDPLAVSYRDGFFWVYDGQHRLSVAKALGKNDVKCVIRIMNKKAEAIEFAEQDENRQRVSGYAKLRAKATAGEAPYTSIMQICAYKNVVLVDSTRPLPGECGSAGKLVRLYKKCGEDGFVWVLDMIKKVNWSVSKNGYSGDVIDALGSVYEKTFSGDMAYIEAHITKKINGDAPNVAISKAHALFPGRGNKTALAEYLLQGY